MQLRLGALADIAAPAWDELLAAQAQPTPFMRHAYLSALADSGSATAATGWGGHVLSLWQGGQGGQLMAAAPIYQKAHSYGEYVFDWAWADAYQRHGLAYYPKWLAAVPFTPVPGSRLLATTAEYRAALLDGMQALAAEQGTSAHLLFADDAERAAAGERGWLLRSGVQFHWQAQGHADFAAFLASLQREKRKKIQQERRRVAEAGVTYTVHEGAAITPGLWDFFYACYAQTYAEHGNPPYLTRGFFARMAADMPEHWLLFVAQRGDAPIACSLLAIDRARGAAWGRYWGALQHVPLLHFDACYYAPIDWCIANGFVRFEGGAQGEHKLARGLTPVATGSAHWLAHPRFAEAVADFLAREREGVDAYLDELRERSPYRT